MILIPFINVFRGKDKDLNLMDKLTTKEAISGLFNVAIAAAKGAIEAGTFTGVGTVDDKKSAYTYASNSVARFIDERCKTTDPDDDTRKDELYNQYVLWARDREIKVKPVAFMTSHLKELGITVEQHRDDDGMRYRTYCGISPKGQTSL